MFNRSFRDFHCPTDKLYHEYAFKPTLAMRKQTKKGRNMKVIGTNTRKNEKRRRTCKAGKEATSPDSIENPKEVMLSEMRAAG